MLLKIFASAAQVFVFLLEELNHLRNQRYMNDSFGTDMGIFNSGQLVSRIVPDSSVQFDRLKSLLDDYRHIYIVADSNVVMKCASVAGFVRGLDDVPVLTIEADESKKTMDTVLEICGWLLERGADRDALVLGVGGGIVLDIAGFAASIYKRGVRYANVPTTLLAQVDAGIGGKTGVNFDKYKNILGVIRQPEFTYLNVNVLSSLCKRDFLSGAAEMLKTFIIEDNGNYRKAVDFFRKCVEFSDSVNESGAVFGEDMSVCRSRFIIQDRMRDGIQDRMRDELLYLVRSAVAVKAGIVSRDQFESGERRKLNLGHTFAHSIETLCRRSDLDVAFSHGEAVAIGIVMAARLAERLSETGVGYQVAKGLSGCLESDLKSCGLPVECPFNIGEMASVMAKDKKAEGEVVHFVLPLSVGRVEVADLSVSNVANLLC